MSHETPASESLENPKEVYSETIKSRIKELHEQGLVTEGYMHSIFESADIVEGPFNGIEDAREKAEYFIEVCIMPIVELCKKFNEAETFLVAQAGNVGIAIDEVAHNQTMEQEKKEGVVAALTDVLNNLDQAVRRIQDARSQVR